VLQEAEKILADRRNEIELIAKALMEHEVISGDDLDSLIKIADRKKVPVKQIIHRPLPKAQAKSQYRKSTSPPAASLRSRLNYCLSQRRKGAKKNSKKNPELKLWFFLVLFFCRSLRLCAFARE